MDILMFFVGTAVVLVVTIYLLAKWVFPKWKDEEILNKKSLAHALRQKNLQALSGANRTGE